MYALSIFFHDHRISKSISIISTNVDCIQHLSRRISFWETDYPTPLLIVGINQKIAISAAPLGREWDGTIEKHRFKWVGQIRMAADRATPTSSALPLLGTSQFDYSSIKLKWLVCVCKVDFFLFFDFSIFFNVPCCVFDRSLAILTSIYRF